MSKDLGKSSLGLDPNVAGLLSYLGGFISGIILFVLEKENKFVRFHAMQSIILFGGLFALQMALVFTIVLIVVVPFINIGGFILWILLMVKAYKGEMYKLPIIGKIAEQKI